MLETLRHLDLQFNAWVRQGPLLPLLIGLGVIGLLVGGLLAVWSQRITAAWDATVSESDAPVPPVSGRGRGETITLSLVTALLFVGFFLAIARFGCQELPENGSVDWIHWRIPYQLVLVSLILVATATDLKRYIIPDQITLTGILIGILAATWTGNFHLVPVWIDWNDPLAPVMGGYIPPWIKQHDHLHGLAFSLAGLAVGGGVTWLARQIASFVLGQEAMGFGDVTLMAMIGSFIGWQPVLFAFALAPLCGLVAGLLVLLLVGRTYVPFGPYLGLATLVVLLTWKWLWLATRQHFGDPITLLVIGGIAAGAFVVLLGGVRLFRNIPVQRRTS